EDGRDLLAEQLDRQLVGAGVGAPVDVPQVVARLVGAVIAELQRRAGALAEGAADHADGRLARHAQRVTQGGLLSPGGVGAKRGVHPPSPPAPSPTEGRGGARTPLAPPLPSVGEGAGG